MITAEHDSSSTQSSTRPAPAEAGCPRRARRFVRLAAGAGALAVSAAVVAGCGSSSTETISNAAATATGPVTVTVTAPTGGSVIAGNTVLIRGTVSPASATVEIQGQPAAVGDGVFTGTATLHGGKNRIDVIGSAPNQAPGSTSVSVTQFTKPTQGTGSTGHSQSTPTSTATPAIAYAHAAEYSSGETTCGDGLSVGPDTTCAFAENVRSSYENEGPGTYDVYSPVTGKGYEMTCSYGTPVVCTGGNNASVYFP